VARKIFDFAWANGRKLVVAVVGTTVILLGVALIVLPGPAVVVIPLGLGILSLEFAWAKKVLRDFEKGSRAAVDKLLANGNGTRYRTRYRTRYGSSAGAPRGDAFGQRPGAHRAPVAGGVD
jgi:uncharacterized protein (TIGR02611 family)